LSLHFFLSSSVIDSSTEMKPPDAFHSDSADILYP